MLLDIIIPQFKEDENEIKPLLDSINNQKNVDFSQISVTIINDYSDVLLNEDFLNSFNNLNIRYLRNDLNTGPGLVRQKGIDNTNGSYIMFCDSDDKLYDSNALNVITQFIFQKEPNYLVTNIMIEGNGGFLIKKGKDTFPWMHGKVFKREFLEKNEIRFHPKVRHLEDSHFTTSVLGTIDPKEICYLDYVTYVWKNNDSSLTRKKNKYHYTVEVFDDFYNSPIYTYEFLVKKNSYLKFSYLISSILGIYLVLYSDIFKDRELDEKRNKYISLLKEYTKKKRNVFIIMGYEKTSKLYEIEKDSLAERNGIKDFYKDLTDFYKDFLNIQI